MRKFGLWKCYFLGWHPQRYRQVVEKIMLNPGDKLPSAIRTRCTRCGYVGLVDSGGNLF